MVISQPGAAPTEIETQITQRVEAAIRSINGVEEINSQAREGSSQTTVQFEIGVDPDNAVNEVKNAVDQIRSDLPDGILEPQVVKIEVSDSEIAFFAVGATDMTIEQLSWFVDDTVAKRLLGVQGMSQVSRQGGVDREIRVILDPAKMQSLGVTASQVNQALRSVNLNAAGGQAEIAGSRQSVRVLGNKASAYDLGLTEIALGGGRTIHLSDIAAVYDGYGEQKSISKVAGRQVVTFSMNRAKTASDVSVYDDAMKEIKKIEADNPGVHFTQLFTSVDYTKDQYSSSIDAMVEGAVLAVVVGVHLPARLARDGDQRHRDSVVGDPVLLVPRSHRLQPQPAFPAGAEPGGGCPGRRRDRRDREHRATHAHGQDRLSGLDRRGRRDRPRGRCHTMSIVAVFVPVGLMPGISGQFFKYFGFTVVVAVLMSLAVARMITPMIAAYFLEHKGQQSHGEGWLMDRYMALLAWSIDTRAFRGMRNRLGHVPTRLVYHIAALVIGTILLIGGIVAYKMTQGAGRQQRAERQRQQPDPRARADPGRGLCGGLPRQFRGRRTLRPGRGLQCQSLHGALALSGGAVPRSSHLDDGHGDAGAGADGGAVRQDAAAVPAHQDRDFSQLRINMVPGTTISQTVEVADRVAAIVNKQPEGQFGRRDRAGGHRPAVHHTQAPPQAHLDPVRARPDAGTCPDCRRPRQLLGRRMAAAAPGATSRSCWRAAIPTSWRIRPISCWSR